MPAKTEKYADIFDVAKAAGVSTATVSRTLNHPNKVKPDTRKRIEKAILDTGYIRNRAAQAIHGTKSGTIGLVVPTLDNAIFSKLIQAFSDELQKNGFSMLVATHDYDLDREFDLVRTLLGHRVEGIALIGLTHRDRTLDLLEKRNVPMMCLWSFEKDAKVNCVGGNNFQAGKIIAGYLRKRNLKHVVTMFPAQTDNDRVEKRLDGVLVGLANSGIEISEKQQLVSRYSVAEARKVTGNYLTNFDLPQVFVAGNDVIAQGIISELQAQRRKIPKDVSVVGFGDFTSSADVFPSITTIRMNPTKVGVVGAFELIRLVQEGSKTLKKVEVPVELIVRESSI